MSGLRASGAVLRCAALVACSLALLACEVLRGDPNAPDAPAVEEPAVQDPAARDRTRRTERARAFALARERLRESTSDRALLEDFYGALEVIERHGEDALPAVEQDAFALATAEALGLAPALLADAGFCQRLAKRVRGDADEPEPFIVGGTRTTGYRDCVMVGGVRGWCCSGTLIAPDVVLTAGHCESSCGTPQRVFFGHDVRGAGYEVAVVERHRHVDYRRNGGYPRNDLMLLVLSRRVGEPVRPLASRAITDRIDLRHRIVGFGSSDTGGRSGKGVKRVADVTVVTVDCAGPGEAQEWKCQVGRQLVASGVGRLTGDACVGDSGGPLYVRSADGQWLLCGVTSHTVGNATRRCGDGTAYVRVAEYLPANPEWLRGWLAQVRAGRNSSWKRLE